MDDAPLSARRAGCAEAGVVAAVAAGGAIGALARYGVQLALPAPSGGLPWSTLLVNASGCLLVGVVVAGVVEGRTAHRLARPFLATGVLGGYTTFSTYAVDAQALLLAGRPVTALAYLTGTLVLALLAVEAGLLVTRRATGRGSALP